MLAVLLAFGALPCVSPAAAIDRGRAIEQFTGAPTASSGCRTRAVVQSTSWVWIRAMTGKAGNYTGTPLFTPRGDRVLFSRGGGKDYTVHIVNWDGSNVREFVKGRLVDVRADSRTGIEWVYSMMGDEQKGKPVRRCLVVNACDVLKIIAGKCDAKRLAAAQWGILDLKVQDRVAKRKAGETFRLVLEAFYRQPQLHGERRAGNPADLGLPLFYDVER